MKKWMIHAISIAVVVVLVLFGALWMYTHSKRFSGETLDMAHAASDAGYPIAAMQLYNEACDEGNAEACQVVRDERDPAVRARDIREDKTGCEAGDQSSCRALIQDEDRDAKARK